MNLADLMTLITLVLSPLVAMAVAASDGAGWFTILYFIGGILLGWLAAVAVRALSYALLFGGAKSAGWLVQALCLLGYMFLPMLAMMGAVAGIGCLADYVARHFQGA